MAILKFLQLLAVAMVIKADPQTEFNGTCYKTSDILSFWDHMADMSIVRAGKSKTIYCCANNFVGNVTWQHEDGTGRRTLLSPLDKRYAFFQRRQQLTMHRVSTEDGGVFTCVASNRTHYVTFNFQLTVPECSQAVGIVYPIKTPPKVKYAAVGDTVTLECLGDFSCSMSSFTFAYWITYVNGRPEGMRGDNPFYSVTKISKDDGAILGSRLTLKKVTELNFTRQYKCILSVPYPNNKSFLVELKRKPTTYILPQWLPVTVVSVVFVIVLSVLLFVVYGPWGSQTVFWFKTKLNMGWPARKVRVKYDVCLISSQESAAFVSEHIYDKLLSQGYAVFYHHEEDTAGRLDAFVQLEGLTRSSHVLLYLSSDEEVEKIRQFFVESCVQIQGGSRIIIIHKGPLGESMNNLKPEVKSKLKIVKSIPWPKNTEENSREMKNFWCSVRLSLPVCERTVEDDHPRSASTSSHRPLIDEENENGRTGDA